MRSDSSILFAVNNLAISIIASPLILGVVSIPQSFEFQTLVCDARTLNVRMLLPIRIRAHFERRTLSNEGFSLASATYLSNTRCRRNQFARAVKSYNCMLCASLRFGAAAVHDASHSPATPKCCGRCSDKLTRRI